MTSFPLASMTTFACPVIRSMGLIDEIIAQTFTHIDKHTIAPLPKISFPFPIKMDPKHSKIPSKANAIAIQE